MRYVFAGLVTVWLATFVHAQAVQEVESIGFGGDIRPGCWTPMVVRMSYQGDAEFNGRLEVVQEDLDRDLVHYSRPITLTRAGGSGSRESRFWMYFIPQGSQKRPITKNSIKVRFCDEKGKELAKLPVTVSAMTERDRASKGEKIVLAVYKDHLPHFDSEMQFGRGLTEALAIRQVRTVAYGLPDNVIGYDSVDAIVWTDPDLMNDNRLTADQLSALDGFVRRGGRLIICQDTGTNQWNLNNKVLGALMPVTVTGVEEDAGLEVLKTLSKVNEARGLERPAAIARWEGLGRAFRCAVGEPKPGAMVVLRDEATKRPYIVRQTVGAGMVTWVAQDLGDRNLIYVKNERGEVGVTFGWANIWAAVMGWQYDPTELANPLNPGTALETGKASLKYLELPSTSTALIGIAVLFFILYWVGAGPVSYLVLRKQKRAHLSWFIYGLFAFAATGMTVLIVKLVLRGDPQVQHVTVLRQVRGEPAVARTTFGLYIPRDGVQRIELKDTTAGKASYVTPLALNPFYVEGDTEFPAQQKYEVAVRELGGAKPQAIEVPYRSTMKKFSAQWTGEIAGGITGTPTIHYLSPYLKGTLVNRTGHDLQMVYFVVHHSDPRQKVESKDELEATPPRDIVIYRPFWKNGETIDLMQLVAGSSPVTRDSDLSKQDKVWAGWIYEDQRDVFGVANWTHVWYSQARSRETYGTREWVMDDPTRPSMFGLLSFYDRLPPSRYRSNENVQKVEVMRRGWRHLDMSSAVAGGHMAIIAVGDSAESPLPFPLAVEGKRIGGKGVIYYQLVIPVDRSELLKDPVPPTTQSATPKSRPAPVN